MAFQQQVMVRMIITLSGQRCLVRAFRHQIPKVTNRTVNKRKFYNLWIMEFKKWKWLKSRQLQHQPQQVMQYLKLLMKKTQRNKCFKIWRDLFSELEWWLIKLFKDLYQYLTQIRTAMF